jgi:hypothetical protein
MHELATHSFLSEQEKIAHETAKTVTELWERVFRRYFTPQQVALIKEKTHGKITSLTQLDIRSVSSPDSVQIPTGELFIFSLVVEAVQVLGAKRITDQERIRVEDVCHFLNVGAYAIDTHLVRDRLTFTSAKVDEKLREAYRVLLKRYAIDTAHRNKTSDSYRELVSDMGLANGLVAERKFSQSRAARERRASVRKDARVLRRRVKNLSIPIPEIARTLDWGVLRTAEAFEELPNLGQANTAFMPGAEARRLGRKKRIREMADLYYSGTEVAHLPALMRLGKGAIRSYFDALATHTPEELGFNEQDRKRLGLNEGKPCISDELVRKLFATQQKENAGLILLTDLDRSAIQLKMKKPGLSYVHAAKELAEAGLLHEFSDHSATRLRMRMKHIFGGWDAGKIAHVIAQGRMVTNPKGEFVAVRKLEKKKE